jgi:aspartate aminotransferase, mitochondrial
MKTNTASSLLLFVYCAAADSLSLSATIAAVSASSVWNSVEKGPDDSILGIAQAFRASKDPRKVNVCVGAYRDAKGSPWVLPSVRKAEEMLLQDNKEYLPIEGDKVFVDKALSFAYGQDFDLNRLAGVQTLSGTGACRIGGEFLARFWTKGATLYIPTPTWGNHWKIFEECGLPTAPYRYYSRKTNRLDLDGMLADINEAPNGSIILLHACAHNPTGCDPTMEQWKMIADVLENKGHVAFFDSAYQGFASGDAERDAAALRYVVGRGLPVLLAQSFAKNFGLYGERCGTLSVVCRDAEEKDRLLSQLRLIIRPMYSSPPRHGSSIVKTVLSDEQLTSQYYGECEQMAARIQDMRTKLVEKLKDVGSNHDWSHVSGQIGMFAFTGMSKEMCNELTDQYAIYLTKDGRISIAGLNDDNLEYVAKAIHSVSDGKSISE